MRPSFWRMVFPSLLNFLLVIYAPLVWSAKKKQQLSAWLTPKWQAFQRKRQFVKTMHNREYPQFLRWWFIEDTQDEFWKKYQRMYIEDQNDFKDWLRKRVDSFWGRFDADRSEIENLLEALEKCPISKESYYEKSA